MVTGSGGERDERLQALALWLQRFGDLAGKPLEPASADASFRRYFRVHANGYARIVMDAPPGREDTRPFVRVAGWLQAIGLNAPRVLAENAEEGFLLLTDLGETPYLDVLRRHPERAGELYDDALAALATLQRDGRRFQCQLEPYDEALLSFELSLFRDWLCGRHLGIRFAAGEEAAWRDCVRLLVRSAREQPEVFVHRDYHSRNLMVTPKGNPGILDFQDAVRGPLTYDLVSLLKDCYVRWPEADVRERATGYFRRIGDELAPGMDEAAFLRDFDLMGVQRHLKAAGIFARLKYRDGKHSYLHDVPRTLGYVSEAARRYEELAFLVTLVDERCLPAMAAG